MTALVKVSDDKDWFGRQGTLKAFNRHWPESRGAEEPASQDQDFGGRELGSSLGGWGRPRMVKRGRRRGCLDDQGCFHEHTSSVPSFHEPPSTPQIPLLPSPRVHPQNNTHRDFPGGPVVKNPPCEAGDIGSIPVPGRSSMPWGSQARVRTTEA